MKIKTVVGALMIIGSYCLGVAAPYIAQYAANPGNIVVLFKAVTTSGLILTLMGLNILTAGIKETVADDEAYKKAQSTKS